MSAYQYVFERSEKKYMLTTSTYRKFLEELEPHMEYDQYGLHTVSTIYFDTDSYQIIRTSLSKPKYKEKLRLRSYGVPEDDSTVFLELKKKCDGVVYKRRIALTYKDAKTYLYRGIAPPDAGQICREIDWFINRYQPAPKVLLSNERMALYGKENPGLRVTFDYKIRYRDYDLDLARGNHGELLLSPANCLMEIKIAGAMPLWLGSLLSKYEIYPRSFSKYGTCYREKLLNRGGIRHVG